MLKNIVTAPIAPSVSYSTVCMIPQEKECWHPLTSKTLAMTGNLHGSAVREAECSMLAYGHMLQLGSGKRIKRKSHLAAFFKLNDVIAVVIVCRAMLSSITSDSRQHT